MFIASGGSEQAFRRHYPALARPVILLADGKHNSLPAALEIAAWVRRQGEQAEIVHGSSAFIAGRLRELDRFQRTRRALGGRIGVIGEPSDWLIASAVDRAAARERWGTEIVDIPLAEATARSTEEADGAATPRNSSPGRAPWSGSTKRRCGRRRGWCRRCRRSSPAIACRPPPCAASA